MRVRYKIYRLDGRLEAEDCSRCDLKSGGSFSPSYVIGYGSLVAGHSSASFNISCHYQR
jgi:hypothetical protein